MWLSSALTEVIVDSAMDAVESCVLSSASTRASIFSLRLGGVFFSLLGVATGLLWAFPEICGDS